MNNFKFNFLVFFLFFFCSKLIILRIKQLSFKEKERKRPISQRKTCFCILTLKISFSLLTLTVLEILQNSLFTKYLLSKFSHSYPLGTDCAPYFSITLCTIID